MKIDILTRPYIVIVNESIRVNTVVGNNIQYVIGYKLLAAQCLIIYSDDNITSGIILFDEEEASFWSDEYIMDQLFTIQKPAPYEIIHSNINEYNKANPNNVIIYK